MSAIADLLDRSGTAMHEPIDNRQTGVPAAPVERGQGREQESPAARRQQTLARRIVAVVTTALAQERVRIRFGLHLDLATQQEGVRHALAVGHQQCLLPGVLWRPATESLLAHGADINWVPDYDKNTPGRGAGLGYGARCTDLLAT